MALNKHLAIGTVQFGLPYGIANVSGKQVSHDVATSILERAWLSGVDTLDTAYAYGNSEQVLGEIGVKQWKIVSKLPAVPDACTDISAWVSEVVQQSLERLKVGALHGLLIHHAPQFLGEHGEALYRALADQKAQGLVKNIGVSIYCFKELEQIISRFDVDLVQAPFNVIDRRLVSSGCLEKLHARGVEIHVRSVFLQGLLLMARTQMEKMYFKRWQPLWDSWHSWLEAQALTPLQACLQFVMMHSSIDRVVVGMDSLKQLQEILDGITPFSPHVPPSTIMSEDLDLINPARWSRS